jgi:hypothetical protein
MLSIIISGSNSRSSSSSSSRSSSNFDFGKTYYSRASLIRTSLFRNFGKSEQDVKTAVRKIFI